MATNPVGAPPPRRPEDEDRSVGEMVFDITERVSILVREEIELAKTEVTEKLTNLGKGAGVGIAAGVFVLLSLAMFMHAVAWLINELLGIEGAIWVGFAIEALFWLIVAGVAGLIAYKTLQKGSPPKPAMAIEEAKQTKATLGGDA